MLQSAKPVYEKLKRELIGQQVRNRLVHNTEEVKADPKTFWTRVASAFADEYQYEALRMEVDVYIKNVQRAMKEFGKSRISHDEMINFMNCGEDTNCEIVVKVAAEFYEAKPDGQMWLDHINAFADTLDVLKPVVQMSGNPVDPRHVMRQRRPLEQEFYFIDPVGILERRRNEKQNYSFAAGDSIISAQNKQSLALELANLSPFYSWNESWEVIKTQSRHDRREIVFASSSDNSLSGSSSSNFRFHNCSILIAGFPAKFSTPFPTR